MFRTDRLKKKFSIFVFTSKMPKMNKNRQYGKKIL